MHAHDAAPPPFMLELGWQCERWHTLPDAGGILDQDHFLLKEITASVNVYNLIVRTRNLRGKQIHTLTAAERTVLKYLMDNGLY